MCPENPICEICWKNEGFKHDSDHPIVQVCIASHRAAVEKDAMSRFMDTSHIQKYKINNKNVVYLKPNEKAACSDRQAVLIDDGTIPKCETCHRKLKDIHYGYCSISCKVAMMSSRSSQCHHQIAENTITVTKSGKRKQHIAALQAISLDQQTKETKRKRRRKGIPRRSPLK